MKHFKGLIPILLLASILCGCKGTDNAPEGSDVLVSDNSSQDMGTASVNHTEDPISSVGSVSSEPTISDNSPSSEPTVSVDLPQREPTESEQVLKLLADYGDFITKYTIPPETEWSNLPTIDKTVSIKANFSWNGTSEVISIIDSDQSDADYNTLYYKVTDEWLDIFDGLATENQKQQLIQESSDVINYEGDIYLGRVGAGGYGLRMSYLVLNSIEHTDENTIVCKVSSVGDKDEWGHESDWVESEVVTIKRTDKGLRIDSCSLKAAEFFWRL